ncbi:MAG: DUF169 domain-containing protein [Deltaproteobacteria bacterium]|nr:DUF169 domain-containing protein [Deltaproteobacteria bacterium]MBW2341904.1 DUF169 domain-containing protein [Deltaproteobacteria bacterium]
MVNLDEMHRQARELERSLRLQSLPLALKMLKSEDEMPEKGQRPVKDMGFHLNFCQALSLSRRNGLTIAQSMEDMWCFEPVVGFGFVKPPKRFLDGYNRYPASARTLEAGSTWARNMPRFECGVYWGVLTAPLEKANFEPDVFIIYGAPAKMTQIMLAKNWLDGRDISPVLSSHAACVYYVVPPIKEGKWQMSIPCGGDLRRAASEDYNMVFSAPIEVLGDLLLGLEAMRKEGFGLPLRLTPSVEYPLPERYVQIGHSIGMDWVR